MEAAGRRRTHLTQGLVAGELGIPKSHLSLTAGNNVTIQVGTGGATGSAGGDTWLSGTSLATSSVGAQGGGIGINNAGGAGGAAANGVGTVKYSGGSGGTDNANPFGGGAAAAALGRPVMDRSGLEVRLARSGAAAVAAMAADLR